MSEWVKLTDESKNCPPMYRYHHGDHDIGYQSALGDTPDHFGWVRLTNEEAIALAHLLETRKWIDVNDRIPTQNTYYNERRYPVVVVDEGGKRFVSTARLFFTSSGDDHAWFPDRPSYEESVKDCVVTHWRPLPKLPGGENDG